MIPEKTVLWQELPAEKREQVLVILVQMLLHLITAQSNPEEVSDEGEE
jgi:hypothetical protein